MSALSSVVRELAGLFVDDGSLALLAVVWVAASTWLLPLLLPPGGCAALLFAGLAAALAYSVMRA